MFANRKVEIKLVKDNETPVAERAPEISAAEYVQVAEEAISRLGKQLIIGAVVTIGATIVAATLGNIAITVVEHALDNK